MLRSSCALTKSVGSASLLAVSAAHTVRATTIALAMCAGCSLDTMGLSEGGAGSATTPGGLTVGATTTGDATAGATTSGDATTTGGATVGTGEASAASSSGGSGSSALTSGDALGEGEACDPWAEDCGDGLKCAPYASDDGDAWDANKCTPVGEGAHGGPCIAMKSMTSGYDTCEQGAICWDVDPATLAGVCYAMCKGSPNTPICPPNSACSMTNGGVVNVCLGTCDPLQPTCAEGQVCVPDGSDQFLCFADASPLSLHETCMYINECELGLMCADASKNSKCDPQGTICCTAYCDLVDPVCASGLACQAYFPMGTAPPGLADLGLCQDP